MSHQHDLINAAIFALLLSGCVHQSPVSRIDRSGGVDTQQLVTRFGYPKCTVSVPLSKEESVESAELVGAPHIDEREDWAELTSNMIPGDELRHVWCNASRGPGGVDFLGVFRDKRLIRELHTVTVD